MVSLLGHVVLSLKREQSPLAAIELFVSSRIRLRVKAVQAVSSCCDTLLHEDRKQQSLFVMHRVPRAFHDAGCIFVQLDRRLGQHCPSRWKPGSC